MFLEFVDSLVSLSPKVQDVMKLGFDAESAQNIVDGYRCIERATPSNINMLNSDPVLMLFQNYDCSNVQIGLINFLDNVQEFVDFYLFGEFESDLIVLNKVSHKIEVREAYQMDHVLWPCASNSERFLHSVLICAKFFTERINNPSLAEDSSFTEEVLEKCIEAAGGEEYADFYKVLLGCE